ncbi:MAG: aminoacetone oxidase family FAD-binding enzyme [Patescibacteria group bacterium]
MKKYNVIVIGGGAAGMMAAGTAAAYGKNVLLLEKNARLGEKLKITGGGRCNITNAEFDTHLLLRNYGTAASFLHSSFAQFGIQDTFDFFASRNLPLVVQGQKRVFPKSERAVDVYSVLEKYLRESHVTIKTGMRIEGMIKDGAKITGVIASGKKIYGDAFILATGGTSHPETGSTGDGFTWLRDLGHIAHRPTPTIVPLAVKNQIVKKLAGVTCKNIKISFLVDGKKQFSKKGDLLFTHFGISGPVVLNSSANVGDLMHQGVVTAVIDFFPASDEQTLEQMVLALFDQNKNKALKNVFSQIAPVQLLASLPNTYSDTRVHSITKEQRKMIIRTLKSFSLTITSLMGLDRAVLADGGVDLHEINNKTMGSALYDNLYIIGDLLHIRRPSGGYSLQLCWTTGFVAGKNA